MSLTTATAPRQSDEQIQAELDHGHEQEAFDVKVDLWFLRPHDGQPTWVNRARVVRFDDRGGVWLRGGRGNKLWTIPVVDIIWAQAVDNLGHPITEVS